MSEHTSVSNGAKTVKHEWNDLQTFATEAPQKGLVPPAEEETPEAQDSVSELETWIKDNPLYAALGATAAAFILAALFMRR